MKNINDSICQDAMYADADEYVRRVKHLKTGRDKDCIMTRGGCDSQFFLGGGRFLPRVF
jgi:hypothetical protein